MTFGPGDRVAYRFIRYGKVRMAMPHVVVEDEGDQVLLHLPVGARGKWSVWDPTTPIRGQAERDWKLRDHVWHTYRVLRLIRFGTGFSLDLMWRAEDDAFAGWYVNLQEPLRRGRLGFDTDDLVLDVWIRPDGSWSWKDEDELDEAVRLGRFTPTEATAVRAEGERVLAERPWPTGWEAWRPEPSWEELTLPQGWERV